VARAHPFVGRDDAAEAALAVDLIRAAERALPGGTTAVLVRSKAHLQHLIGALRAEGVRFQALEIGALADRPAIMDLLSLALAMLHPADRVSWLALLAGPLCGMALADLHALTGADCGDDWTTVPDLLADPARRQRFSDDGQVRAAAFWRNMEPALDNRGRTSMRGWVEGLWLTLGGPATLRDDASVDDVEVFFRLLEDLEDSGQVLKPERLCEAVQALYAPPDPQAGERLQLMTIHKAKGLEFDTVILPGLGKRPRSDGRKLLYWLETTADDGKPELFFGPVKSVRSSGEPRTSAYIRALEQEIGRLEEVRLLYVAAATRARRRLHLIGHADVASDGSLRVEPASLLARLWPAVEQEWEVARQGAVAADDPQLGDKGRGIPAVAPARSGWRLPAGWECPLPPATAGMVRRPVGEGSDAVVYEWAGDTARAVGTVVHRWLQHIAQSRPGETTGAAGFEAAVRRMLLREGVPAAGLDAACARVRTALERTLQDERGRWILSDRHAESSCEVAITARIDGELRALVVDRTFIDAAGVRWIIDYKTGTHEGGDVEGFLDREEERYRDQLMRYAAAFHRLEDCPIKAALYYPLVPDGWREVRVDHSL
jgi:ATP-dependent exoDNAse (exonuclease V) beta subunit